MVETGRKDVQKREDKVRQPSGTTSYTGKHSLDKNIDALTKSETRQVLTVLSSHRILDALTELKGKCPDYTCCPCDVKTGNTCGCDSRCCACDSKYGCSNNLMVNVKLAEIYETLRSADRSKIDAVITRLKIREGEFR